MCGIIGITVPVRPCVAAMCGIIGVTGSDDGSLDVLLEGLARLEYRGYDSAGVALVGPAERRRPVAGPGGQRHPVARRPGQAGRGRPGGPAPPASATPGGPPTAGPPRTTPIPTSTAPAGMALIHNGIIENHVELADELIAVGHHLESETDTEVLAHLVESALAARPRRRPGRRGAGRPAAGSGAPSPWPWSTPTSPTSSWPPAGCRRC